jgi:hypothetical protein
MTRTKADDASTEKRRARLREIVSRMDERWPLWIIEAATKHYAAAVKDNQDELLRLSSPVRPDTVVDPASLYACSEAEQGERTMMFYKQNQAILEFLMLLRDEVRFVSIQNFARDMAAHFGKK